jgi:hypothetical protein
VRRLHSRLRVGVCLRWLVRLRGLRLLGLVCLMVADRAAYGSPGKRVMAGNVARHATNSGPGCAACSCGERCRKSSGTDQASRSKTKSSTHKWHPFGNAGGVCPDLRN